MKYFHVPDIVNVEALLEAHDQPGSVQLHGEDSVAVAVLADLRALLEVTHAQLPRGGEGDECEQGGGEQSLHNGDVSTGRLVDQVEFVEGAHGEEFVAGAGTDAQGGRVLVEVDEVDVQVGRLHCERLWGVNGG